MVRFTMLAVGEDGTSFGEVSCVKISKQLAEGKSARVGGVPLGGQVCRGCNWLFYIGEWHLVGASTGLDLTEKTGYRGEENTNM
mmetsp:Transcript_23244/g.92658  ORF Transcript_23244/g.92658 Transcript_23244/m.92658 type:complete len:84 (-) Transcript_23244:280-531(-)